MIKKTKQQEKTEKNNSLLLRLHSLFDTISDDDCKLEAFINFCEKVKTAPSYKQPRWVERKTSFFSALNVVPKDWKQEFEFPIENADNIAQLLLRKPELFFETEAFEHLKNQIESILSDCNITPMCLCELVLATRKLHNMSSRMNVGEVIASSTINSLLDVVCSSFGTITMNGDKQSTVCLSDELPVINIRNDGYLYTQEITFLLKEDNAFDETVKWYQMGTDCHKLIICMKSLLRENMQKYAFKKEAMTKYSKVMGLSYLKRVVYLFILEANFEEVNEQNQLLIIPKYSIYMKQYSLLPVQMLKLFLDIGYYIQQFVPKDIGSEMRPYRPTPETTLNNFVGFLDLMSTQTTERHLTPHKRMKNYKKVIGCVNNNEDIFLVRTTSVIKDVNSEERSIILKLVNRKEYSLHLPQILNIYSNCVEFERLQSIIEDDCKESYILKLALDISVAISYLHSNKLVHRDVKPSNIMTRSFNSGNISTFVLIDFGLSFEIVKEKGWIFLNLVEWF